MKRIIQIGFGWMRGVIARFSVENGVRRCVTIAPLEPEEPSFSNRFRKIGREIKKAELESRRTGLPVITAVQKIGISLSSEVSKSVVDSLKACLDTPILALICTRREAPKVIVWSFA